MRVLVVEDEPLARATLEEYLAEETDIEVVAAVADGRSAIRAIEEHRPDLVFLDVHLPELSGLEVLQQVEPRPAVVFTTAYDRYAVTAFELEAVDYLVKPFGRRRFRSTLARVRRRLPSGEVGLLSAKVQQGLVEQPLRRLYARRGKRIVPVPVEQIEHLEGAGDYCRLHRVLPRQAPARTYLVPLRLKELENRLDPEHFLRLHRSHMVNLDHVGEIRARDPHRFEVVLRSGKIVPASRSGSARLRDLTRL